MGYKKKIAQLFFVISLLLFFSSCKDRCYSAEEFDSYDIEVDSKPTNDGIIGTYDAVTGGQTAEWHNTGLVSNGDQFVITVSGSWVPWQNGGKAFNSQTLTDLPRCNFCAKRSWDLAPNCVCYDGQSPDNEYGKECGSADIDNPALCTCTNKAEYGSVYDYGFYHIPLNYYEKNETPKIADRQDACKYDQGMGLYVGLFGAKGVDTPKRQYHLFSQETVCPIRKDSNNECVDENGIDRTRYVYRSPNDRIFMKDDNNGNDGRDTDTSDDVYHGGNEVVKFIISDDYYGDNYGKYNISILKGVGYITDKEDKGILEFLVRLVEDVLLGKLDENNERQGGIIEFMYKSIVQDSVFIITLRAMLALYIAFYGIATLFGIAEINKKELISRLMKIGLILFFTSTDSWKFYSEIVVGFFYDSMNYMISLFTSLSGDVSGVGNTPQLVQAEYDGGRIVSNASRFAYIDTMIMMLLSESVAAKIFGLIFTDILGIFYVVIIYSLIAGFIVVMLFAASVYAINIMKVIFVLSIGPVFICFTLFTQTAQYFKNWIGYLGARSLEMVIMFFILYTFVMVINTQFNSLLYYEACVESFGIGTFTVIKILRSDVHRSVIEWFSQFISIGALIFITKLILDKIPTIAGQLISIGGVANKNASGGGFGQSSFGIAGNMLFGSGGKDSIGGLLGIAKKGLSAMSTPATQLATGAASGAMMAARASGLSAAIGKYTDMIPINNPRAMYRNSIIDAQIKSAQKEAKAKGLDAKATDAFVRKSVTEALHKKSLPESFAKSIGVDSDRKTMMMAGIDPDSIAKRLDQKLIEQPLQKALKEEAARIKASDNPLIGKELKDSLTSFGQTWAKNNLSVGADDVSKYLAEKTDSKKSAFERKLSNALESASRYSSSEAAKAFAGKPELQSKYMESLAANQSRIDQRRDQARKGINTKVAREITGISSLAGAAGAAIRKTAGIVPAAGNMVLDGMRSLTRSESANPTLAAKNFVRESQNIEQDKFKKDAQSLSELAQGGLQKINPLNNSSTLKDGSESAANSLRWAGNKIANLTRDKDSKKEFTAAPLTKDVAKDQLNQGFRDYLRSPAVPRSENKELTIKDNRQLNKKAAEKEANKRTFAQRKLREVATKDRDLNKEIKSIKALEARGKAEEAKNAKIDLMNRLTNDLIDVTDSGARFKKDGTTVFERLTRIDHVQNQLNIKEFSAQTLVSDLLKEKFNDREKEISQISKDKNYLFSKNTFDKLQSAIGEARQLNNGLFFDDHLSENSKGNKALDEIAEALSDKMRGSINGLKNKGLEDLTDLGRAKLAAESLVTPTMSSKDFENAINQDRKTNEESAQIQDKLKDLEDLFKKAEKEKEEKDLADKMKKDADDAKKKAEEAEVKERADAIKAKEEAELKAKEEAELQAKNKKQSKLRSLEADDENLKLFGGKGSELENDTQLRKELEKLLTPEEQIGSAKEKAIEIFEALSQPDVLKGLEEKAEALDNLASKLEKVLSEFEQKKLEGTLTKEDEEKMAYISTSLVKDLEDLTSVRNASVSEGLQGGVKEHQDAFAQKAESIAEQLGIPKSDAAPLIPTSFEVQFGSSITDILLKEFDIGLKAGNPFLGIPDIDEKQAKSANHKALDQDKKQNELKLKIKNLDKKVKEFELQKAKDNNDLAMQEKLNREINEIEAEINNLDLQNSRIEKAMES